ncbi:hypothetical protein IQ66_16825 [Leptospira borgpetersenii serovar Ballum]|nr:Uncharacterized protein LB4E_1558 [Leptospira borgpetersenii str. 4E]KGE22453.1 hypothetical protein IQ66_16825 [Leptospira borgpetersenii serovar Ballum]
MTSIRVLQETGNQKYYVSIFGKDGTIHRKQNLELSNVVKLRKDDLKIYKFPHNLWAQLYLELSQNLRNVKATTILNDGRKPPMRRFLWELPRFLKTCQIV